ncbi:MAG TPA: RluA family pseudouridine synthase [Candidatus Binatia bacterium]|jgi:23S rRNA pseudouridine1911/1915/1917 synthase
MDLQDSAFERCWAVSADRAGSRVDAFLRAQLPFLSRREVEDALGERYFFVNGRRARKGDRVAKGDVVQFTGPAAWLFPAPIPNPRLAVPVLYEDGHLLALNKPAGIDCHGFSGRDDDSLANFLVARWPALSGIGKSRWEPGLVHRLDRETSGVVLIAKTQAAFDDLRRQFGRRAVKKTYLALVWGSTEAEGTISFSLAHDPDDKRKMQAMVAPGRRGPKRKVWPALTHYRKVGEGRGLSLLELEMKTGVTHQLRAHLAAVAHPILGDVLYGAGRQETFGLRRHFLHAAAMQFMHPASKSSLMLKAPLPAELSTVLVRLRLISGLGQLGCAIK